MFSVPINHIWCACLSGNNRIGGVMVSVLAWSVADHGFIGGVMVGVLAWSVADHGFEPLSG